MNLKDILKGIDYQIIKGEINLEINKIAYDSRKVEKGDVFVCIEGYSTDGHKYIGKAIEKGAAAIICTKLSDELQACTVIKVENSRRVLAAAAANYYDHPAEKLKLIGVTGTNGKTTSTYMIKAVLESAGYKTGLIGTIANYIGDEKLEAHRTTPESLELHELFHDMVDKGVDYCVMEVSSHSLYLDRVYGITFNEGIFTNLTQDHLDFHKTFENYFKAKMILFQNSRKAIINIDDKYGERVFKEVNIEKVTYGIDSKCDVRAKNLSMHARGVDFDVEYLNKEIHIKLNTPGRYNVFNALDSIAACLMENISLEQIKEGLEGIKAVPGRCELVHTDKKLDFEIILDYAHSPDSLENILKTAREFTKGRLISVFGCGGDRDKTKRPIMGSIGAKLSDIAIVTSDNPRSEEPSAIIEDVVKGIASDNYVAIEDRTAAIKKAIMTAQKDDVIVIAGKGHEDYQVLKDKTIHYDEREIIAKIMEELF